MNAPNSSGRIFLGMDVGTGSARAGLFTEAGEMLSSSVHPVRMWKDKPDFAEQSSDDIWQACCRCVEDVRQCDRWRHHRHYTENRRSQENSFGFGGQQNSTTGAIL